MNTAYDRQEGKDEWLTPPEIFRALQPFDLDVCQPVNPPWLIAEQGFNKLDDGLAQDWFGFVWCNPPYGSEMHKWMYKMNKHGVGIALIFARTDTETFHDFVFSADAILFIKGRLAFYTVDGVKSKPAGSPSCLVAFGDEAVERLKNSNIKGKFIKL